MNSLRRQGIIENMLQLYSMVDENGYEVPFGDPGVPCTVPRKPMP